jgi:hypothetical protein
MVRLGRFSGSGFVSRFRHQLPVTLWKQNGRDVDKWRARAITRAAPAEPLSLAAIQAEMERLAALALSMVGAQDTPEPAPGDVRRDIVRLLVFVEL